MARSDAYINKLKVALTHTNYYITSRDFTFYCAVSDARWAPSRAHFTLHFSDHDIEFSRVSPEQGATNTQSTFKISIDDEENIFGKILISVDVQLETDYGLTYVTDEQKFYFYTVSSGVNIVYDKNGYTFKSPLKMINYHNASRSLTMQPYDINHNAVDNYYKYVECTWTEPDDFTILGINCPIENYKFKIVLKNIDNEGTDVEQTIILEPQQIMGARIDNMDVKYDFFPSQKKIIFYDWDYYKREDNIPEIPTYENHNLASSFEFSVRYNYFSKYETTDDDTRQSSGVWRNNVGELSSLLKEIDDISFDDYIRPNQNFNSEDFKEELQLKLPFKETMNYPNAGNRLYGILQNFVLQCIYKKEQSKNDIIITKNNFNSFWRNSVYGFNLKIPHRQLINNIYETYQKVQGKNWSSEYNNNKTWYDDISFNIVVEDVYGRTATWSEEKQVIKSILLKEKPYWENNASFSKINIYSADGNNLYDSIFILNKQEYLEFIIDNINEPNNCDVCYRFYYGLSDTPIIDVSLDKIKALIDFNNETYIDFYQNQIKKCQTKFFHNKTQYMYFYCEPYVQAVEGVDSSLFKAEPIIYSDYIRIGRIDKPTLDLCTTDLMGITYRFSDNGGDQNLDIGKNYEDYLVTDDIKYGGTNLTRFGTEYLEIALTDEYGNEIDFSLNTEDTFFIKRKMGVINNDEDDGIEFIKLELEEARRMLLENQKNTFAIDLDKESEVPAIQNYLVSTENASIYVRGRFYYSTEQQTENSALVLNSTGLNEVIEQQEIEAPPGCIQFIHELTIKILGPTVGYRKNGLIVNPATDGQDQLGSDEILKINLTSTRKNINIYDNDGELCVSIYRDTEGKFHLKGAIIDELEERIAALEAHHS